jgi:hypothetical protein
MSKTVQLTLQNGTPQEMKDEAKAILYARFLHMEMMLSRLTGSQRRKNKDLFERVKFLRKDFEVGLCTDEEESVVDYVCRLMRAGVVIDGMIKEIKSILSYLFFFFFCCLLCSLSFIALSLF